MDNVNQPAVAINACKLYLAAAIGALALGMSDYMSHSTQSTVIRLAGILGLDQVWVLFLFIPILGCVAAWIHQPGTKKDAFTLGLAVFSVFALAPQQQEKAITDKIGVSIPEIHTGLTLSPLAFAQEPAEATASANVTLLFEGEPPPESKVSVTNVTEGELLGTFTIRDSLKLVGKPGDKIKLNFEAPGHQRTQVEVPLAAMTRDYKVRLKRNTTPLFLQRLVPAIRVPPSP
jgi:hypothetical protein